MKRSEINAVIREFEAMCEKYRCYLPPFCSVDPEDWKRKGHEYDEIRECMLGWDITDYGLGNFAQTGLSMVTLRNGNRMMAGRYPKVYAEKLMYLREGQHIPEHFHWYKTEDLINRGGGNVLVKVYNSLPDESIDYVSEVAVSTDGRQFVVPAGTEILLAPGESIFLRQYMYHSFSAEKGTGPVLLGEVSQCSDDRNDNRFSIHVEGLTVEEDEPPYRLLCSEYPEI